MELSEKQKAAHRLASDYLNYLTQQEALLGRMFERKWQKMQPQLEGMIERKIQEHLSS